MGCTGGCCEAFSLSKQMQLAVMQGKDEESAIIRAMVIPLGDNNFTCKHWDRKTRLCKIYERRPQMCKDFPAKGNPCGVKGCTL